MRFFFLFLFSLVCFSQTSPDLYHFSRESGMPGISGQVFDAETSEPLPARIVLTNSDGQSLTSYYSAYPGLFTTEDGMFSIKAEPGLYELEVFHGIDYLSQKHKVEIEPEQTLKAEFRLQSWVPLRQMGWVNGDGHAHLYTDKKHNDEMLKTVRQICRAQGVDFLCANQGWAGYGDDDWRKGYAKFSDEHFLLHYGAEMPKYRTGHTWWLGLTSTYDYFSATMDSSYENQYYKIEENPHWTFDQIPFLNIPDVYVVPRLKQAENAVACIPHPTSWWWQKRGAVDKYTTNVCEYLSYSLLAGILWDGLVVMGYNADHYFYQNLWFHVLNQGYKMTPLAELDGGYGPNNKFPYGLYRIYYHVGDEMSMYAIVDAARNGRTFVTSGPLVSADIDGKVQVGGDVTADGRPRTLNIKAFASGDADDHLSYIMVFRNGEIFKLWDVREDKPRRFQIDLKIQENQRAWYVVKVYGQNAQQPENLDVFDVCQRITSGKFTGAIDHEADVCLTSPFYFWPPNQGPPQPLRPTVHLTLKDSSGQDYSEKATIEILHNAETVDTIAATAGRATFRLPLNAILQIKAPGYPIIRRGLYLDYKPHRDILEHFANGDWLEHNNWQNILAPGQVPWKAFQFEKTRQVLRNIDWTIELKPNERDPLWHEFDHLF